MSALVVVAPPLHRMTDHVVMPRHVMMTVVADHQGPAAIVAVSVTMTLALVASGLVLTKGGHAQDDDEESGD